MFYLKLKLEKFKNLNLRCPVKRENREVGENPTRTHHCER
jgi:hypothetical protein